MSKRRRMQFFACVVGDFGGTFDPGNLPGLAPDLANRF
jgi:hypothetical protein